MKQIKFLENVMYAISEADTEQLRDFLMLYTADDTELDALQENAREIWEEITFYHEGFTLLANGKIDREITGEIDGTTNMED